MLLIKQRVQLGHTNIVHYRPSQLICQVKQQEEMFFSYWFITVAQVVFQVTAGSSETSILSLCFFFLP